MNISFDLDSTIIPHGNEFEIEKRSLIAKILCVEPIRKGTVALFRELQSNGHSVHIYTTSYRSKWKIRQMFWHYNISVKRIVNQSTNIKILSKSNISSSKYPPAFNFDIHIDDSEGVGMEADRFNFYSIIIKPSDDNWATTIKRKLLVSCNEQSSTL